MQKNFDRPVEWGMIKDYPWSTPQLRKLDVPVNVHSHHASVQVAHMSMPGSQLLRE